MDDAETQLARIQLALGRFHERLQHAATYFRDGDERTACRLALGGTVELASSISLLGVSENLTPFIKLLEALDDVDDSLIPPLFNPGKRRRGRPLDPTRQRTLRGYAAGAMQFLLEPLGYSTEEASLAVAGELERLKIPVGNTHNTDIQASAATIGSWRAHAMTGNQQEDRDAFVYYDFVRDPRLKLMLEIKLAQGRSRETIKGEILEALREVICRQIGLQAARQKST
jgi:hypothetical protein